MAATTAYDDGDDLAYDEVPLEDDDTGALAETDLEDPHALDALVRSVQATSDRDAPPQARADLTRLPVVVDDFVRNYLVKHNLMRTLESFELEWYERYGANPEEETQLVPDIYLEHASLIDQVQFLSTELTKHRNISEKATMLWEHVKKERDLHRMSHNRVMQEKSKISADLKRLQHHALEIEPTVTELRLKYEQCQKDKMLRGLERDKLLSRIATLEEHVRELEGGAGGGQGQVKTSSKTSVSATGGAANNSSAAAVPAVTWPADQRPNPYAQLALKGPTNAATWSCRNAFKGHTMAVTGCAIHPKKPVCATSSDDGTWRLVALPQGELIMSGEGHSSWIAGIAMHPKGTMAATASGDKTVKIWDFASNSCKHTLKLHTDGAWAVDFNETGELLVSGALDHTARVWDVETGKGRQTLRGHVDAVNSVVWQPYSNLLATASADKTVSLWDARANYCVQTFYGHTNSVTKVAIPVKADQLASCDAEGNVILWDTRTIGQRAAYVCGPHAANCVAFDKSGQLLAVGSDDALIRIINLADGKIAMLKGHEDAVQCVAFDPMTNGFLVSSGADCTVRYWS